MPICCIVGQTLLLIILQKKEKTEPYSSDKRFRGPSYINGTKASRGIVRRGDMVCFGTRAVHRY